MARTAGAESLLCQQVSPAGVWTPVPSPRTTNKSTLSGKWLQIWVPTLFCRTHPPHTPELPSSSSWGHTLLSSQTPTPLTESRFGAAPHLSIVSSQLLSVPQVDPYSLHSCVQRSSGKGHPSPSADGGLRGHAHALHLPSWDTPRADKVPRGLVVPSATVHGFTLHMKFLSQPPSGLFLPDSWLQTPGFPLLTCPTAQLSTPSSTWRCCLVLSFYPLH